MAAWVQMVFQDPASALNPRHRVATALTRPLTIHGWSQADAHARAVELLDLTGLPATTMASFPHQLNTGERQRVVTARALTLRPRLLLADEAVSRLDVSMQSRILNLLLGIRDELGVTVVFITHDLSVVRQVADRVAVMYLGPHPPRRDPEPSPPPPGCPFVTRCPEAIETCSDAAPELHPTGAGSTVACIRRD